MENRYTLSLADVVDDALLERKQMNIEVLHPNIRCPNFNTLKLELAQRFGVNDVCVSFVKLEPAFGGGKSVGVVHVYNNFDAKVKFDKTHLMVRTGQLPRSNRAPRKARKNIKVKCRKLRGKAKVKVRDG
jgi:ribosomal protein S24E